MIPSAVYALCKLIDPNFGFESEVHDNVLDKAWRIYRALTTPQVIKLVAHRLPHFECCSDPFGEKLARELIDRILEEAGGQYGA